MALGAANKLDVSMKPARARRNRSALGEAATGRKTRKPHFVRT